MIPTSQCRGAGTARAGDGSKSLRGTQVAALFYTLCESAKLVGVDPHTYLLTASEAALATPGAVMLPEVLLTVAA